MEENVGEDIPESVDDKNRGLALYKLVVHENKLFEVDIPGIKFYEKDGNMCVSAATLCRLIDKLVDDYYAENEFGDIFWTFLDYFTSPMEVFKKLIDLLKSLSGDKIQIWQIQKRLRLVDTAKLGLSILGNILISDEIFRKKVKKFLRICFHAQIPKSYFEENTVNFLIGESELDISIQPKKSKKTVQQIEKNSSENDREKDTEKVEEKKGGRERRSRRVSHQHTEDGAGIANSTGTGITNSMGIGNSTGNIDISAKGTGHTVGTGGSVGGRHATGTRSSGVKRNCTGLGNSVTINPMGMGNPMVPVIACSTSIGNSGIGNSTGTGITTQPVASTGPGNSVGISNSAGQSNSSATGNPTGLANTVGLRNSGGVSEEKAIGNLLSPGGNGKKEKSLKLDDDKSNSEKGKAGNFIKRKSDDELGKIKKGEETDKGKFTDDVEKLKKEKSSKLDDDEKSKSEKGRAGNLIKKKEIG